MQKKIKVWSLRLITGMIIIPGILLINSCQTDDCMMCRKVTYEDGMKINESSPAQYCDEALDQILDEEYVEIGNKIIRWECK